jgi:molybdate transport system ATP-binding protein
MGSALDVELQHRLSRLELDVALSVGHETLALVGPSGAGKSTILRAIAGLVRPDRGRVVHGSKVLLDTSREVSLPPEERRVGMVYQDGALFPFMSVLANVAYGVRGDGRTRRDRAQSVLERFGISALGSARPGDLSGGERQRVALARALASEPGILLLDEPLSALDAVTRSEVAAELARRLAEVALPTIMVSHDFADVLGLADRVAVLQLGRIVQSGAPHELAEAPTSAFVASLAGVNYFVGTASRRDDLTEVRGDGWASPLRSADLVDGPVGVAVYPWDIALSPHVPEGSALNAVAGSIRRVAVVGNRARISVDSKPPIVAEVTEESVRRLGLGGGSIVVASWKATATRLVRVGAVRLEPPPPPGGER